MKDEKKFNKQMFKVEAVIGIAACVLTITMVGLAAALMETQPTISAWMIAISIVCFVVICLGLTKIEQVVGYYVCRDCHHKHVPGYNEVLWSMHLGRTRYMRCPKCKKMSWQKKVA